MSSYILSSNINRHQRERIDHLINLLRWTRREEICTSCFLKGMPDSAYDKQTQRDVVRACLSLAFPCSVCKALPRKKGERTCCVPKGSARVISFTYSYKLYESSKSGPGRHQPLLNTVQLQFRMGQQGSMRN